MRPLSDVTVLDFSKVIAGPLCSQYLMDMGAEIIKVENIDGGDDTRVWPPFQDGTGTVFNALNRGKKSISLNLKSEESRELVRRLSAKADVVVESFAPSVKTRLGIDYDTIRSVRPDIVYCSISGFGQFGPMSEALGYDNILQAYTGMMSMNGFPDRPPARLPISPIDQVTGINSAYGILGGLMNRLRTGEGCRLETSLFETAIALLGFSLQDFAATGVLPERRGSAHASICPYQVFETSDTPILLGIANDRIWSRFCKLVDRPELIEHEAFRSNALRVENRAETVHVVSDIIQQRGADDWIDRLNPAGVPATRVNTLREVMQDAHTKARGILARFNEASTLFSVDTPIVYGDRRREISAPPPALGAHTNELLGRIGYAPSDIEAMKASGVVV